MDADLANAGASTRMLWALPALLCCAATSAFAFDEDLSSAMAARSSLAAPADPGRPRLEVSASTLPRFDNTDGASRSSRLDMTWLPPRRSALGVSLGMTSPDAASAPAFAQRPSSTPSVDLGVHWRYTMDSNDRVDVTAWRRLVPPDALTLVQAREPTYGARVEMQVGSLPSRGFVAERGFVGLQLESGARVTLRRSGGKPMVYYRRKF